MFKPIARTVKTYTQGISFLLCCRFSFRRRFTLRYCLDFSLLSTRSAESIQTNFLSSQTCLYESWLSLETKEQGRQDPVPFFLGSSEHDRFEIIKAALDHRFIYTKVLVVWGCGDACESQCSYCSLVLENPSLIHLSDLKLKV
jgi:hypothetical protein